MSEPAFTLSAERALVALRGVDKQFANGTLALHRLDLDIHDGEFVCLLGPSGCGKSTVLRLIADLDRPSYGRLIWPGERPECGFVFQEPNLLPWATVIDNVYLPFRLKGEPRAAVEARLREALAMVGLADFADAYPRELSGGMKMRVSIARALVTRPKLLLMDEPFAALDEITRNKLNQDLVRLWQQLGCTVVFVTHSVVESVQIASRIVVMAARPGRLVDELPGLVDAEQARPGVLDARAAERCQQVSALLDHAMQPAA